MPEGSLEAPTRHPIDWENPEYFEGESLDNELRRIFDICHGCRRCFNLCDSFPRLFDLIDESQTGELDSVASSNFGPVVDACTLCDLCFMTKCPYVPPHEFNVDFPHLMLRYRAVEKRNGQVSRNKEQLSTTDRNGKWIGNFATLDNRSNKVGKKFTRIIIQKLIGIKKTAALPKFYRKNFTARAKREIPTINVNAPAFGRKAVLYATCFVNYNNPQIGGAARKVLARNGVKTEVIYPRCCGMPKLEHGDLEAVAENARKISKEMGSWINNGYDIIALVPSCALMLKFEWPLILPNDENVKNLSSATYDITEYLVNIAKKEGIAEGLHPIPNGVTVHLACHARAQNIGAKAAEMLRLLPKTDISVIERCSGHGGSWGIMENNFEIGMKVGKPVVSKAIEKLPSVVVSECPLAGMHILQGIERSVKEADKPIVPQKVFHPIELMAEAYNLRS